MIDEKLSMMPDLIIFLIFQCDLIDKGEFVGYGGGEGKESGGAVKPDCIMSCVQGDDVFGKFENAGRVFFACHYGAQVSHC